MIQFDTIASFLYDFWLTIIHPSIFYTCSIQFSGAGAYPSCHWAIDRVQGSSANLACVWTVRGSRRTRRTHTCKLHTDGSGFCFGFEFNESLVMCLAGFSFWISFWSVWHRIRFLQSRSWKRHTGGQFSQKCSIYLKIHVSKLWINFMWMDFFPSHLQWHVFYFEFTLYYVLLFSPNMVFGSVPSSLSLFIGEHCNPS